jgi:hypothetical protein
MENFKIIDGKKYMWDGEEYPSMEAAREIESKYTDDGFRTQYIEEDNKHLVYTRRVVTEIVVEGQP